MTIREIPARNPDHVVLVGWDVGLDSYWGKVVATPIDPEDDDGGVLLWVGTAHGEINYVNDLPGLLADYAVVGDEVLTALCIARAAAPAADDLHKDALRVNLIN
jgi:hypothetical protein